MGEWYDSSSGDSESVVCIACGDTVSRSAAREYDKYGDRWDRDGKRFEHLCKPCDKQRCNHSRDGLEELLVAADAGGTDEKTFLRNFAELVERDAGAESRPER
jgi:hypothetical protein